MHRPSPPPSAERRTGPPVPLRLAAMAAALAAGCAATPGPRAAPVSPGPSPLPVATPAPPSPPPAPPPVVRGGTTTLGFGILRLAPGPGRASGTFRIRYVDLGDGGYSSDGTNACLFAFPVESFARSDAVYADAWIAFDRIENVGAPVECSIDVTVDRDRTILVAYGPWDGPDAGRPPSDTRTYSLRVASPDGGTYRWVESEAGEMVTTNWTGRPGVRRGGPVRDPLTGADLWIETRVLVLYDARVARRSDADPATDPAGELLVLTPPLHEVLARVPIKWR